MGCNDEVSEDLFHISTDSELLNKLYDQSVDTLYIDGHRFILDAFLWRDYMPICPPDGKNLISINWLINIDSVSIPDNLDITNQYVINNDSIWLANYETDTIDTSPFKIKKSSSNGPKWGPNISVDVIVKVFDTDRMNDYYIRKIGVPIYKIY